MLMAFTIDFPQFIIIATALGSLISSVQAFRASRSGQRSHVIVYLVAALVLIFMTIIFLPHLAKA